MVSHQCIQFQISLRCITLLNRISSYLICSSTHRKLVALNSKFLRFQSYEDHFLFRAKVAGFSFFMILVDTSQTKKVKSKSVSDMDFPDQSQCTKTEDTTFTNLFLKLSFKSNNHVNYSTGLSNPYLKQIWILPSRSGLCPLKS